MPFYDVISNFSYRNRSSLFFLSIILMHATLIQFSPDEKRSATKLKYLSLRILTPLRIGKLTKFSYRFVFIAKCKMGEAFRKWKKINGNGIIETSNYPIPSKNIKRIANSMKRN